MSGLADASDSIANVTEKLEHIFSYNKFTLCLMNFNNNFLQKSVLERTRFPSERMLSYVQRLKLQGLETEVL